MRHLFSRWVLYITLFVLYALHNDLWLWHDPRLLMGLPVGLLYHIGFCLAAAVMILLLVTFAWPPHLQDGPSQQDGPHLEETNSREPIK